MAIQQPRNELQPAMLRTWEAHLAGEFQTQDVAATMATMTAAPSVVHLATLTGGRGTEAVRRFYGADFIPGHPPDTRTTLVDRVITDTTIVDELVHDFTHTIEMPWMLPGVPPTGRPVRIAVVAVVEFAGTLIEHERIYFDQASVLAQIGLLDATRLPVVGREAADLVSGVAVPTNALIARARGGA